MTATVSAAAVTALLDGDDPLGVGELDSRLLLARIEASLFGASPPCIGRYRVDARVGRGGGGTVYRGFDPLLQRAVAIKVLSVGCSPAHDLTRLRREAEALARLDHPNVVQIFDVAHEDVSGGFVVMQWVDGVAADVWLRRDRPDPPRIVKAFVAAARGLVAAHDAGLVHGDVKPSNILVARDGRVRLADFGLARITPVADAAAPRHAVAGGSGPCGTPAYMAPEQWGRGEIGPQADQFAWCVALIEALTGALPDGNPSNHLANHLARAGVPRRITDALVRGLSMLPGDRFADMHALLRAIDPPRPAWRRWTPAVAGLGVTLAAVLGGAAADDARCSSDPVWPAGDDRAARLQSAFAGTGQPFADTAAARTEVALVAYVGRWRNAFEATCHGDDTARAAMQRVCLQRQREGFDSLVALLLQPDAELVTRAVEAAAGLPAPEGCGSSTHAGLAAWDPDDSTSREAARVAHRHMAEAAALSLTGRHAEAAQAFAAVVLEAEAGGLAPVAELAQLGLGRAQVLGGDAAGGRDTLAASYFTAVAHGYDREVARAATDLAFTVGYKLADPAGGRRWARHAEAALDRIGLEGEPRAELLSHRGIIEGSTGDLARARDYHEAALRRREPGAAGNPTALAHTLNNLGNVWMKLGDHAKAHDYHERALALRRSALGPSHPMVATSMNNLASAVMMSDGPEVARPALEETLALWESVVGPDHPDLLTVLHNLVLVAQEQGETGRQRAYAERAYGIARARYDDDHPAWVQAVGDMGDVAIAERADGVKRGAMGQHRQAIALLESALAWHDTTLFDAVDLAEAEFVLARSLLATGGDRARALVLAAGAAARLDPQAETRVRRIDIERWLAGQPHGRD